MEEPVFAVCQLRDSNARLTVPLNKPDAEVLFVELFTVPGFDAQQPERPQEVREQDLTFRRVNRQNNVATFEEVVEIPVIAEGTVMDRVAHSILLAPREQREIEEGARPRDVLVGMFRDARDESR